MSTLNRLGVNIDHIATLRQARQSPYPDPVAGAVMAEMYGAEQITCHIRSDRRHIQDSDLARLRDAVQTQLNVEMACTQEMLTLVGDVLSVHPNRHRVTLVPENPNEVTTEGGLDVVENLEVITATVTALRERNILVSLFVDPDIHQIRASNIDGIDMIEINTAQYAEGDVADLKRIKEAALLAQSLRIEVAAGHGLTHLNLSKLVQAVPEIVEYPLEEVISATTFSYFNNTVAYAVAFAVAHKVGKIHMYGVDFSYKQNIHFAEAGRSCVEFWCAMALGNGIAIQVAPRSGLLDTNVPEDEKIYGYHRLDDPLVQKVVDGNLVISRKSKLSEVEEESGLSSPEPLDGREPVLIGRHDIEGVSYKKEQKDG